MKLVGMLDSPYVRRVAVSLELYGVDFVHEPLSVFSTYAEFAQINPVVKAPSLVLDDGTMLMDSSLILDYLEALAPTGKSLMPGELDQRLRSLRLIGLALAACEKSVQLYYERNLRPAEIQFEPWVERVEGQLAAAYSALERELEMQPLKTDGSIDQDGITLAVAWSFTHLVVPDQVDDQHFPQISAFTAYAEGLDEFLSTPIE